MGHIQPGIEVAGPQHFVYIFSFALTNRIWKYGRPLNSLATTANERRDLKWQT
ncbi:Uncharacterized protein APZ42_019307 [Daphnia magna]|uniref:Uncharacterized protein n=1 Tax=Daphnia magna TaxID=35525 RepID=A0A162CP39_9CRUS|nr:Uncharacterized protein APZ42_019307 [Daphnia magna]